MGCKFGWLTTGRDQDAVNLLMDVYNGIKIGDIQGEMAYVFLNRGHGEGPFSDAIMELTQEWGIPLITVSSAKFYPELKKKGDLGEWRELYHLEVLRMLRCYGVRFSVLAGYMLIVGEIMCRSLDLINLHPAKPDGPAGTWQEVIWQLIENRASESGIMIHKVTPELDKGPPITYCSYDIMNGRFLDYWNDLDGQLKYMTLQDIINKQGEGNPLFKAIRQEGVLRESPLLYETIKGLSSGRLEIKGNFVYHSGIRVDGGVCMTKEIEANIFKT